MDAESLDPNEDADWIDFIYSGGAAELMDCRDFEVLIEGPAGTGKTRAVLEMVHRDAELYDGCRQLLMRKSRSELTESVLVTFEDKVIQPGHEILNGPHRSHRSSYRYSNGSVLVLGGMDSQYINRIMSTEYDRVVFFEAIEFTEENWQKALSRCRNGVMPYQQLIADTNPGDTFHWLNMRADAGQMTRVLSRHVDNPFIMEREAGLQYLRNLDRLTGATRKRLLDGSWVGQEGQIWEEFDFATHVKKWICREYEGRWWIIDEYGKPIHQINWFIGGIDWGWKHPGVQHVYAIDNDGSAHLVHEVYRCGRSHEWWLSKARASQKKYGVYTWVADPSEPAQIDYFYHNGIDVKKAMNAIVPGLDAVRDMLAPKLPREVSIETPTGRMLETVHHPRSALYFLEEALDSRDPGRVEARKPCRFTEEVQAYRWREPKEGQPVKEEPNPLCADHACFVADTMVLMADLTEKRIADIQIGEFVATPLGAARVLDAGMTGSHAEVVDLDGLIGTGKHPVWTKRGWIPLDSLRYGDTLCAWENTGRLKLFGTTPSNGGDTQILPIPDAGTSQRSSTGNECDSTDTSMSSVTGECRKAVMFTTSTVTRPITPQRTSRLYLLPNIPSDIRSRRKRGLNSLPTWLGHALLRQNGTEARRAASGIVNSILGGNTPRSTRFAKGAASLTRAVRGTPTANIVTRIVRQEPAVAGFEKVYNLTVEHGCYFANGVLVSNCDVCRYVMSFLMYNDWREFVPKPKYHKASLGAMMGHDDIWERINRGDFIR